jgi:hypothetical protein
MARSVELPVEPPEPDLSEFEDDHAFATTGVLCPIGKILADLPPEKAQSLTDALSTAHPNYKRQYRVSAEKIRVTLMRWGYRTGSHTIGIHRRKVCGCPFQD